MQLPQHLEGLYLLEKRRIKVVFGLKKKRMGVKRLKKYADRIYERFNLQYVVYKDLREKGYIVLPGIKFGCEYALYKQGPGIDHSPYLVTVKSQKEYGDRQRKQKMMT